MWLRTIDDLPVDGGVLAMFADFIPSGVGVAAGGRLGGYSLDNTLRIVSHAPTRWVLCDTHIQAVSNGFAHGDMRLFAETGELLALASQTLVSRPRKD